MSETPNLIPKSMYPATFNLAGCLKLDALHFTILSPWPALLAGFLWEETLSAKDALFEKTDSLR